MKLLEWRDRVVQNGWFPKKIEKTRWYKWSHRKEVVKDSVEERGLDSRRK